MNEEIQKNTQVFICECCSLEHQFVLTYWEYEKDPNELIVSVHLSESFRFNVFNRIWIAIKYIFGFNQFPWDDIILNPYETKRLRDCLDMCVHNNEKKIKPLVFINR